VESRHKKQSSLASRSSAPSATSSKTSDKHAFKDDKDIAEVMARMVDNGIEASPEDLRPITWYLNEKHIKKK
jgi:hypothetical protein